MSTIDAAIRYPAPPIITVVALNSGNRFDMYLAIPGQDRRSRACAAAASEIAGAIEEDQIRGVQYLDASSTYQFSSTFR